MEGWMINVLTIVAGIIAAAAVAKYRVDRLEKDREKDGQNIQAVDDRLASKIDSVDERHRQNTATLFHRVDENRQAGGILESRLSAIESIMEPGRIHDHNKQQGAFEARLGRNEQDIKRVEEHLVRHLQHGVDAAEGKK